MAAPEVRAERRWTWVVAVAVPTLLVALHASRYGAWIVDDAGISFAYARNLASGEGPVLQPGASPVEGFSNPAWIALLVVGRWLRLFDRGDWFGVPDLVLFPKALALACCAGVFAGFHSIARVVASRPLAVSLAAGIITAAIPSFVIWTTSGLENALLALAVVALAAVLVRAAVDDRLVGTRTAVLCGALAALAALTRPDGLLYVAAFPIAVAFASTKVSWPRARRAVGLSVGTAAVPLGAYLVWRLIEFGRWVPNPAVAKEQGLPGFRDLDKPADLVGYFGWVAVVATAILVVLALQRSGRTSMALRMLLVPLGLAVLAYAVLAADWMTQHRFATPVWPLMALVLALAVADVLPTLDRSRLVATTAVLALAAMVALTGWRDRSEDFRITPTVSVCYIARNTGATFNLYADRLGIDEGTLLAVDGGGTSLTSRLRYVDLSGLGDERIADLWHADDMAGLRDNVFDEVQPTFIRIWHGWDGVPRTRLLDDERLLNDYVLVWGPGEGGGNYVRRDAVTDQDALAALQQEAPALAAAVDAPYAPGDMAWHCPSTLRPPAPGSDPTSGFDSL